MKWSEVLFFAKNLISNTNTSRDITAIYENGKLKNVVPRKYKSLYDERHRAFSARYIVSDSQIYDLEKSKDVSSIIAPRFCDFSDMPSSCYDLSYNFQVRLKKEERKEIAIPLAYKTAEIMYASPFVWSKRDYYRVVIQLWSIGAIEEADMLLESIKKRVPVVAAEDEYIFGRRQSFEYNMGIAKQLNEDYLYTGNCNPCPKCAPFINRVYSISGKDHRFPKLSDYIEKPEEYCCLNYSGFFYYEGCKLTAYIYDKNGNVREKEVDAIKHSNRPFKDDRSEYQKKLGEDFVLKREKQIKSDARYYNRQTWIDKYNKNKNRM